MNISSNHNNKLLKNIKEASLELFADEYEKMNKDERKIAFKQGIKKHVLRYWEKRIDQLDKNILSIKKGRDGKRRYYRDNDIQVLKKIKYLMYSKKYTMHGAVAEIKNKSINTSNYEILSELKLLSKNLRDLINN